MWPISESWSAQMLAASVEEVSARNCCCLVGNQHLPGQQKNVFIQTLVEMKYASKIQNRRRPDVKKVCTCLAMTLQWQNDRSNATFSARHIFDKLLSYKLLASNFRSSISDSLFVRVRSSLDWYEWAALTTNKTQTLERCFGLRATFQYFEWKRKPKKCFTNCLIEKQSWRIQLWAQKCSSVDPSNVGSGKFWQNMIKTVEHSFFLVIR